MAFLTDFLIAMLLVSAILWAAASVFQRINPQAEQWSSLWALALGLSVLIPMLGLATRFLPDWAALPTVENLAGHGLLPPISSPTRSVSDSLSHIALPWDGMIIAALILYLLGVALRALILMIGRLSLYRLIREARPFGQKDGIDVALSARTRSAFAWTPLGRPSRARIVIPTLYIREMTDAQIADIMAHERAHIARRDDEYGLILRGLLCLCWVSPFAHALFARWSQAAEIQCDMAVTADRAPQMRKAYAETLLHALHIMAGRVRQYPAAAFSTPRLRNKKSLRNEKMRITHIVNGTRPSFKRGRDRIGLALTAACLTLGGTLSMAAAAQADEPKVRAANHVSSAIVTGRLTAPFGKSFDPFKTGQLRMHKGVDIAAPLGTPIYAPASGTIRAATNLYKNRPGYGTVVVLETDGGVTTLFAQLDSYDVRVGQRVTKGEQIATVGSSGRSTGPHVHIETFKGETRIDPMTVWDLAVD